jgi:hypothetical protein
MRQAGVQYCFSSTFVGFLGLLGCGEHLVRTILARECSHALQTEDAHQALLETMQNKFISKYTLKKMTSF